MTIDLSEFTEEERLDIEEELNEGFARIEEQYAVDTQSGFENVLVLDNVPIVDESKRARLIERLRQAFAKAGAAIDEERVSMPWDDAAGTNKGFLFLTYPDGPQAEHALRTLNGTSFGKNVLHVNRFGDIERYANLPVGEGELPTGWRERPYAEKAHLRSWLADPAGRDQFVTFHNADVGVYWNGRNGNVEPVRDADGKALKNPKWGELFTQWSPLGTYFCSLHRVGVVLWSGPSLDGQIGVNVFRFTHPGVRMLQFSPCENYLVTWADAPLENYENSGNAALRDTYGPDDEGNTFVVWDVKTARVLRTFPPGSEAKQTGQWPVFKWSPDDAYVARCVAGQAIQVYELPEMGLLDKKSVKIDGVQDFEWCPMSDKDLDARKDGKGKECMLAFWTPEAENQPARVNVMAIPSRQILRSKNLFNVTDCKFFWQNQGDYLCVKVDRHARKAKTKKATFCNLELFRVREKDLPVEVIEHKEYIPSFAWEPSGNRFVVVSTADPNYGQNTSGGPGGPVVIKYNVSFYAPDPKKGDFAVVKTLADKITNTPVWSPRGRHIVLATVGSSSKFDLEFWDLDFSADDAKRDAAADPGQYVQLLAAAEHYGMTDIAWDPSGRYVATWGCSWRPTPEPGFSLWDFKGQELQHHALDKFKQFLWRPRPPTLLSKEQQKKIRKELKEHSRQFDDEDAAEENRGSAEKLAQRQREIAEWDAWRRRNVDRLLAARASRGKQIVRPAVEHGAEDEKVEEWIEELIDEAEETVVE
ncbi:Translation initiation factor 3 subunit b [Cryptotrichosporon argae]